MVAWCNSRVNSQHKLASLLFATSFACMLSDKVGLKESLTLCFRTRMLLLHDKNITCFANTRACCSLAMVAFDSAANAEHNSISLVSSSYFCSREH